MHRRVNALVAVCSVLALSPVVAAAQDQGVDSSPVWTLRTSIKATGLLARSPDAPELFAERTAGESLFRVRIEPEIRPTANTVFTLAYEHRLRYRSGATGISAIGILPSDAAPPFRIRSLVWRLRETDAAVWRHEVDRASAAIHARRADVTLGRQAIGWGRGVMFTAVDLFAPFSPLEADREWRPGVDAVRADIRLTDRSSLDLVAAFGTTLDASAFAARARGYAGAFDVEVMGGRRAEDLFGGVSTSAPIGDAELHGEAALFRMPSGDAARADFALVWKLVVGGAFRVPVGSGILAYAEYHYSGLGASHPEDILPLMATPSFVERFLRGDLQTLSRHTLGVTGSYEASPEMAYSGHWLHNPRDRSGILAPAITYTFGDAMSLLGAVYVPYGRPPRGGVPRSEYGTAALSGLLQFRLYL